MSIRELDPADLSPWDLRVHLSEERAGGWEPKHFVPASDERPVCEQFAGVNPGDTYSLTSDRGIWERWYAVAWGCQACAEVLHS